MRDISSWGGGTPEIIAMSNILNSNISVNNDNPYQPINQNSSNTINIFHVNDRTYYNFILTPEEVQIKHPIGINYNQKNVPVVNKRISTNKNMEKLQTTIAKKINKYNTLLKEEKQQKLNKINNHYQNISENDKKSFKDKLKTIVTAAIGAEISVVGTKITVSSSAVNTSVSTGTEAMEMTSLFYQKEV